MGGGQDKPAWTACPPGVKITRVGGKITRDSLPPGGQAVQGGKINCYTGCGDRTRGQLACQADMLPIELHQQGDHWSGKSQGSLQIGQGNFKYQESQGKVREFHNFGPEYML